MKQAEPKGSNPDPWARPAAICAEANKWRRGSKGRIRDLCMRLAGKRAERNRPEPTGVEYAFANFLPLPCPVWKTVSKGATPAGAR